MNYVETMCGLAADKKRIKSAGEELTMELAVKSSEEKVRDAAPEMLLALNAILRQAKSWHDFHHGSSHVQCDAICELIPTMESAIAKAEGR